MESFLNWLAEVIQDGIIGVTGGSTFMILVLALLGLTLFFWRFQVSMPIALMSTFLVLGVLSQTLNNPVDAVLGAGGFTSMIYLILVVMTGILFWHLLFKKSQAGVG